MTTKIGNFDWRVGEIEIRGKAQRWGRGGGRHFGTGVKFWRRRVFWVWWKILLQKDQGKSLKGFLPKKNVGLFIIFFYKNGFYFSDWK